MANETIIVQHKALYNTLLPLNGSRYTIVKKLAGIIKELEPFISKIKARSAYNKPMLKQLQARIDNFTSNSFAESFVSIYSSPPVVAAPSIKNAQLTNIWALLYGIAQVAEKKYTEETNKFLYNYKLLNSTLFCLETGGLHPEIKKRNAEDKRYNVKIDHTVLGKTSQPCVTTLISLSKLREEFIDRFHSNHDILINGIKIPPKKLVRLTISSTLLKDDEVKLFKDNKKLYSDESFVAACIDETDYLLGIYKTQKVTEKEKPVVPFIGELFQNLNTSAIILDYYYSLVPQPANRDRVPKYYVGSVNHFYAPFQVSIFGAYPLMKDWDLLNFVINDGHFEKYKLGKNELYDHLKKYAEGFIKGYYGFENDIIKAKCSVFDTPGARERVVYDYATGGLFKGSGFPETFGSKKHVLSAWPDAGREAGYFYRAWYIILENSKRFEVLFSSEQRIDNNDFTDHLIRGIAELQKQDVAQEFISALKDGIRKDEAAFRNFFRTFFSGLNEYQVDAEASKGNGRIDLKLTDKTGKIYIIEFKGWWNSDAQNTTEQVVNYMTDFEDTGYIVMINNLKKKDIREEYEAIIKNDSTFYIENSWEQLPYQNTDFVYFSSVHKYNNRQKKIFHFIYRLYP